MFSFKKKPNSQTQTKEDNSDLKERLFFHDIINHTHGLLLFLNSKEMSGKPIEKIEIQMMEKEIKTLQSLIRDHYNFKHKNLVQTYDWVPFSYAKLAFTTLAHNYLSSVDINVEFSVEGDEELLYYPCFYRIMNNLIKNISESNCSQVDFSFKFNGEGLYVETKNTMNKANGDQSSEYLARVILDEKVLPLQSLGLDSIHHMAEENGGSFTFEISNNTWVNRLHLPTKKSSQILKSDKNAA